MHAKAAITVLGEPEEIERLWSNQIDGQVSFRRAPGDRGTEIHVTIEHGTRGGRVGEVVDKVRGALPRAKAMDELRRFKQRVETGVLVRSDGAPEGELAERKLHQRPAQPLREGELTEVGVS
jgi:hypothetical protein